MMKDYLSEDFVLILAEESIITDNPTSIFVDNDIKVSTFKDKDKLKKHVVDNVTIEEVEELPEIGNEIKKNRMYKNSSGIYLCDKKGIFTGDFSILEKIKDKKNEKTTN